MKNTVATLLCVLCFPACDARVEALGKIDVAEVTDQDRRLARLQFVSYCASCHGKYGRGDGPTAKGMIPNPRNWTDKRWQESVTDERLYQVIRDGGVKFGLSPLMAPNPQHGKNPGVLKALVEIVRRFGK